MQKWESMRASVSYAWLLFQDGVWNCKKGYSSRCWQKRPGYSDGVLRLDCFFRLDLLFYYVAYILFISHNNELQ